MTFEKGVPTAVNGKKMKVSDIIRELNRLGGKHGIGIIDIVENRVVGMKSRGVYETPSGTILMIACFNVIGSLSMLIIDKKADVVTLLLSRRFTATESWAVQLSGLREAV